MKLYFIRDPESGRYLADPPGSHRRQATQAELIFPGDGPLRVLPTLDRALRVMRRWQDGEIVPEFNRGEFVRMRTIPRNRPTLQVVEMEVNLP